MAEEEAEEAIPPFVPRGQLQKLGGAGKKKAKWEKRNFELSDETDELVWTKNNKTPGKKPKPSGALPLDEIASLRACDTEALHDLEGNSVKRALERVFIIQCTEEHKHAKQYFLAADDEDERDNWLAAIIESFEGLAIKRINAAVAAAEAELGEEEEEEEESDEMKEIRDAFDSFDVDKNGSIDAKELGDVLRKLGRTPDKKEVKSILKSLGATPD